MTATTTTRSGVSLTARRVAYGVAGGLVGGVVFGIMMTALGMIGMIAGLVGSSSVAVGWIVHLAIASFIGAVYGLVAGGVRNIGLGLLLGAAYGLLWWVLGGLLLMPAGMGMPVLVVNAVAVNSLIGHLAYGVVLGAVVAVLARRQQH
jgi:uncharacterized membrane protein YagU involved in acid resistance